MPELPEVETTARLIAPHVLDRRVTSVDVGWGRTIGSMTTATFRRRVVGATIARVWRRAKYIVMDLDREGAGAGALLVHLRMSGRLVAEDDGAGAGAGAGRYARLTLGLADGSVLRFLDVRKFGRFLFVPDAGSALGHLGPEPLESGFTAPWLHAALAARRRMIKPLLLDQAFLAGLGNIYVDEALHAARLHPCRRAETVSRRSAVALHAAIRDVLRAAIEKQGASFDGFYRTPEGQPGAYQSEFRVYGRGGAPCPRCGAKIRKLVVGQRGTHVCPRCQRRPRVS